MAGEDRSVRISFEAREELSRAITQIDSALDNLKTGLASLDAKFQSTDAAASRAEDAFDDIQGEANQATISLSALAGELGILDAQLAGLEGEEIDIDVDGPESTDLEEIRAKVIAELETMDPEMEIGSEVSVAELQEELQQAGRWIDTQTKEGVPSRPLADIGVDLDESTLVKELQKAQAAADASEVDLDVDADDSEASEEVRRAARAAETAAGAVDLNVTVETGDVDDRVRAAIERIEETSGKIDLQFAGPSDGQTFSAMGRVAQAINTIEDTGAAKLGITLTPKDGQQTKVMLNLGQITSQIEDTAAALIDIRLDLANSAIPKIEAEVEALKSLIEGSDISTFDISLRLPVSERNEIRSKVVAFVQSMEGDRNKTLDIDVNLKTSDLIDQAAELKTAVETIEAINEVNIDVDMNASDEIVELASLVASMSAVQASAFATGAATRTAASGIDEMGDEARESAQEMTVMASVMNLASLNTTALSLNVGAFNIALSNLATQIPILIGLIGTLATALMGLVGVLSLATVGVSAFIGAGLVAELERVSEEFDNIEGKAEAIQAIMQSLTEVFMEAIEPLTEMSEATDIFFGAVNRTLRAVNMMAKSIADAFEFSNEQMQEFIATGRNLGIISDEVSDDEAANNIMSLGEFMDEVGDIFSDNAGDIIASFEVMSAFLLPVLADIIAFFVEGMDDMILFTTKFTLALAELGPVFGELINFAVELINLTSTVLQGLLPVLVGLLGVGTALASAFNSLNPQIVKNIAGLALLAKATSSAFKAYKRLRGGIADIVAGTQLEIFYTGVLANLKTVLAGEISAATGARRIANLIRSQTLGLIKSNIAFQMLQNSVLATAAKRMWTMVASSKAVAFAMKAMQVPTKLATIWTGVLAGRMSTLTGVKATLGVVTTGLIRPLTTEAGIINILRGGYVRLKAAIWGALQSLWGYISGSRIAVAAKKASWVWTMTLASGHGTLAAAYNTARFAATQLLKGIWNLTGAKLVSFAATLKEAGATFLATTAKQGLMAATWGAVAGLFAYAASAVAGAMATLGLAGAYATLSAATGGLLTLLPAIAVALIAIVGAGAVLVGVLANMDGITSGLGSTLSTLKDMLMDIVNIFLDSFIGAWNSMMDGVEGAIMIFDSLTSGIGKIAEALGFAGGEGNMLAGVWDVMMAALDALLIPVDLLFKLLGGLAFVIGGILATAIDVIVSAITIYINIVKTLIGVITDVVDQILEFIGISGGVSTVVDEITGAIDTLIDALMSLPQVAGSVFSIFATFVEDIVNTIIGAINSIIRAIPSRVRNRLGVETIDDISLQGPEGRGDISRDDIIDEDTGDAENEVTPEGPDQFTYNEENINNVAQEINADPEDSETLSRVVEDAMEEANAFTRRNQGHGG